MKYCKKCSKDTERYSSGHCKYCVKKRTEKFNKKRSDLGQEYLNYEKIGSEKVDFNKDDYTKFNLTEILSSSKNKYIYFLLQDDILVYIGKSYGNLLSRLNSHIKDKEFNEVYLKSVYDSKSLDKFERKWIEKYRPKLNKEFIFNNITYDIFDLKTEEKITVTKEELIDITKAAKSTINNFLYEKRNKLKSRYVLYKNRPKKSSFREVLDTHTGIVEKHNYITFSEKVGKPQNEVWYFIKGLSKTFMKKRYKLLD